MLAWESYVEAQALRARGWSISAIATHTRHDRKTIRAYLNGERRPGGRAPARPEELAEFVDYCRQSQRAGQVVVVVGDGQPRARSRSKNRPPHGSRRAASPRGRTPRTSELAAATTTTHVADRGGGQQPVGVGPAAAKRRSHPAAPGGRPQARTGRPTGPGGDLMRPHAAQPTARCAPTSATTRAWAPGSRAG
jgi:hypothetical protein